MTETYTRSVLILTTAALQAPYNAQAAALGFGPATFTVPLYPAGGPFTAPSHYVCRALMQEATYRYLLATYAADVAAGRTHFWDFSQTTLAAALAALGLALAPAVGP